jgi:tripartite-type tricarboxylate transporter receptor subunit TctC
MGKKIGVLLAFLVMGGLTAEALSQEFPSKAITLIVGDGAGGIMDLSTRLMAQEAKKITGQEILVENKVGASHMVAISYIITQKPDGYTLYSGSDAPFIRGPHLLKVKFDPIKETTPIILYSNFYHFFVVPAESPFKSMKEVLAYARENPGKLTIGNMGFGAVPYLAMAQVESETGLKFSHVPFAGEPKVIAAMIGGHIMAAPLAIVACIDQIRAGKLKPLAVLQGEKRLSAFPEIPTLREVTREFGMKSSVIIPGLMLAGQQGLPEPIVKKLVTILDTARKSPAFQKFAQENYLIQDNVPVTGQALQNHLNTGYKETGELIRKLGIEKK